MLVIKEGKPVRYYTILTFITKLQGISTDSMCTHAAHDT